MNQHAPRLPAGSATHLQAFLDRMDDAQLRVFLARYLEDDLEEEEMFGEGHPESLRDGVYDMLLMECAPPHSYDDALAKIERCVTLATADKTEPHRAEDTPMSIPTTATPTPNALYPTRFSDEQVLRITNLLIDRYERLGLRQLVEEIAALNDTEIADDTAALISELLTAQGHGPEDDPTYTFLAGIMQPPGPAEDPAWREDRTLRCVSNAIALGLHVEEDGALVRVLLEDPDEVVPAEWQTVYDEIMRRAVAEIAK